MRVSTERNTMASLNLEKFIRNSENEQIEVEGFTLEFSPEELPEILKSSIPFIKMVTDHNSHEWDKLCGEINEARRNLAEAERARDAAQARAEANERRAERLKAENDELKEEKIKTYDGIVR